MPCNRIIGCLLALALLASAAMAQDQPPRVNLRLVEKGFENPLYFTHDSAGRDFVVDQRGVIWLLVDGKKSAKPYLDITDRVHSGGECGLLSVAFHPKFAGNGRVFVDYTSGKPKLHTVIAEFKADPAADSIDASTEKILLTIDQPQSNHNGGLVLFGPDGMLYIGMGDGGAGNDRAAGHVEPGGNGQNRQQLLGKILRIDIDSGSPYGIPKDNPFAGDKSYRPEIWALGMRNPWRFSFDRKTGQLFCGDVGQNKYEEVDVITRGGNYGWRVREGLHPFAKGETPTSTPIDPIAEYSHSAGQSITGGFVYRGKKYPELQGVYLYADFASGRIWGLKYENDKVTWQSELPATIGTHPALNRISISSFGEDVDGELYVCDHSRGFIYRVEGAMN